MNHMTRKETERAYKGAHSNFFTPDRLPQSHDAPEKLFIGILNIIDTQLPD